MPRELTEAARLYRAALALQPENAWERYHLARVLSKSGDREQGLEQYRRALDMERDNADFRYSLTMALDRMGRPDESRPLYEQLAKLEEPWW